MLEIQQDGTIPTKMHPGSVCCILVVLEEKFGNREWTAIGGTTMGDAGCAQVSAVDKDYNQLHRIYITRKCLVLYPGAFGTSS